MLTDGQPLTDDELTRWVVENLEAIAEIGQAHPGVAVPSCPGWTVTDLVDHIAPIMMGWYCHNLVTSPDDGDFMRAAMSAPPMPEDLPGRIAYLRESGEKFAGLVATLDLDAPVWTFGPAGPARFWLLRAATESAIHRWDAEAAVGAPSMVSPARAATSIDETVRGIWRALLEAEFPAGVPLRRPELPAAPLAIRATDSGRGWLARSDGGALTIAAVEGGELPGSGIEAMGHDLMLYLWGRPAEDVRLHGSPEVVEAWNLCVRSSL